MTHPFEVQMILSELDILVLRIEALEAHPKYTEAGELARKTRAILTAGNIAIHKAAISVRW